MEYEPGLMWLAGLGEVNHHTLSDFRANHPEELKRLFSELLGVLSQEGFVKVEGVAHDGTKVRAQAGGDSFRREATLEKEIAKAQQMVAELERQGEGVPVENARREAAQRRAARERSERMKQAAEELKKIRAGKESEQERAQARVSLTEPEARNMKHGDNAIAPSYNVQISTDVEQKIVVGIHLTQSSSDSGSLPPAMEQVKETMGQYPEKGRLVSIRMTENAEVAAFREKMKSETARRIYQQRGAVAEFPNAWIKEKLAIRKFRLRGMAKATTEALWGALTYDVLQWVRL